MGGQATVSSMYRFGPQGPPLVGAEIYQLTIGRGCSGMLTYYSGWLDKLSKIVKYITKQTFGAYFAFQLSNQHQSKYLLSTPPDNYKSIKLMPWSPQIQSGSLVLLQSDHMVTRQGWAPTMDQSECWKCDPMADAPLPPGHGMTRMMTGHGSLVTHLTWWTSGWGHSSCPPTAPWQQQTVLNQHRYRLQVFQYLNHKRWFF